MAKKKAQNSVESVQTEEQTFSFNLVTEPWIKVLKDDGTNEMLSLKAVFEQADRIIELSNENLYVDASITLILFAIIYTAYSRHKELKQRILSSGKFEYDAKTIVDYLGKHENMFDLYDKEHPFLQVTPEMALTTFAYVGGKDEEGNKTGKSLKILTEQKFSLRDSDPNRTFDKLDAFSSSLNKKSQWSLELKITDEIIARNFITYRLWHTASNGTPRVSTGLLTPPTNKGSFALAFVKGSSLKDLFALNFKANNLTEKQKPMWEIDPVMEFDELYKHRIVCKNNTGAWVYFNILEAQDDEEDGIGGISRILTYSNVNVWLDKKHGIFQFGYKVPAKLFKEGDKWVVSERLSERLNVISYDTYMTYRNGTYRTYRNYSIAKKILDDKRFVDAKQVNIILPPIYGDQKGGFFSTVFAEPVTLIGNGALRGSCSSASDKDLLHGELKELCSALEDCQTYYSIDKWKSACSFIENLSKNELKARLYKKFINDATSLVEKDFYAFSLQYVNISDNCVDDQELAQFLKVEGLQLKKHARNRFRNAYRSFVFSHCKELFFALTKGQKTKHHTNSSKEQTDIENNTKKQGDFTMSNYIDRQKAAENFNRYVKHCCHDLVALRDMRNDKYKLDLGDGVYVPFAETRVGNKHDLHMIAGIKKALYLWSNHEYVIRDGIHAATMHPESDTVSYKETFGYVLYLKSRSMSNDEWKNEMRKYRLASSNLDKLVRYMRLTIKDVSKFHALQLDYGRFAYYFSKIIADDGSMDDFLNETMIGYSLAKQASEPIEK